MDFFANGRQDFAAAPSGPSPSVSCELDACPGLKRLWIGWSEVERLCGLEVNELWVGSLWAGAYRLGASRRSPLSFIFTELLVIALAAMVSLPLGLLLGRNPAGASPDAARAVLPFVITVAIAMGSLLLLRYRRLGQNRKRWRSLLGILDEMDRYHETLNAIALLDQLQEIHPLGPIPPLRPGLACSDAEATSAQLDSATLEALTLTRDSLVTGLLADRLLRQQQLRQGGRSRYLDLLDHLDHNLATLTAFDASQRVTEEAQLLQNALQISVAVRRSITR